MKNKIFVGALFALLLSISGLAHAGNPQTRPPFSAAEFNQFMADYPALSQWLVTKSPYQGNEGNPWIMSGMRYDRAFIQQLQKKGWKAPRFFYLLDHINMGLLTSQAEAKRDAAKAVMEQQRERMQARMAAGHKKFQEQMKAQMTSSNETAHKQWAAQRARIANNPQIPPIQKKQILAQMDRSKPSAQQPMNPPNREAWQAKRLKQQQEWIAQQKQQIMNNPYIPPQQKKAMVAQVQRSMTAPTPPKWTPGTPPQSPSSWQAQHEKQITARIEQVRKNPNIPPQQKQRYLKNLQRSLQQVKNAPKHMQQTRSIIPEQENSLIKENRMKLMQMFFPEM